MYEEEYLDSPDRWLASYTDQGMEIAPDDDIIRDLISRYPFEGGVLYRGMNFDTEADWQRFLQSTKNGTLYSAGGISSWSTREDVAAKFSVTRPTYYLNRELMSAESLKRENRDYMIGAAGVVLSLEIGCDSAVDVCKSKHQKEDEVILPPGSYKIKIYKVMRPFMQSITDENYSSVLRDIKCLSDPAERKMFDHITNRFDAFSDSDKEHIFTLIAPSLKEIETQVLVGTTNDNVVVGSRDKMPDIYIGWNIPDDFFNHSNKIPVKARKAVEDKIKEACHRIDSEFDRLLTGFNWEDQHFHLQIDHSIQQAISSGKADFEFIDTLNRGVGQYYNKQNSRDSMREVSGLGEQQARRWLNNFERKIHHALSKIISRPHQRKLNSEKAMSYVENSPVQKKSGARIKVM
jgi:hypothetical protein